MTEAPGYWMNETSGVLRPAVEAYLFHEDLSHEHIATLRAYFRQWVNARGFDGPPDASEADRRVIARLRSMVDGLVSRETINVWLMQAANMGIDPLSRAC